MPYWTLQWWVPQGTSLVHWKASGPGTAIWPDAPGGGTGIGAGYWL
ncbi:MAG: hypothetical protein ABSF69_22325 [Polyangiaceae bacterium]